MQYNKPTSNDIWSKAETYLLISNVLKFNKSDNKMTEKNIIH